MSLTRRNFLRSSTAMLASAGPLGAALSSMSAMAADTSGYKALVCVFFKGGVDGHDMVMPFDQPSYDSYSDIRAALMAHHSRLSGISNRRLEDLLPLSLPDPNNFGSRRFALPPSLSRLHSLFENGNAAIVGNVGPLIEPTNRTSFLNENVELPKRLFSHNDQQATWMSLSPEGQAIGWGGKFADAALRANANGNPVFSAISLSGNEIFLIGEEARQYQLTTDGAPTVRELEIGHFRGLAYQSDELQGLLDDHYDGEGILTDNLFKRDLINIHERSNEANGLFNEAFGGGGNISTVFPRGRLSDQLKTVAETIAIRNQLNVSRQVFIVSLGGFDTHGDQATRLPALQAQFSEAIGAFYDSTVELGIQDDVTLFTASDFGRTLSVNTSGTEHGWGGHQFIVGGAVNGGAIYGDMPESVLDHDQDSGHGRLIPTTSVEQMAAPLGRWFGLNDDELNRALPMLSNFSAPPLGFI